MCVFSFIPADFIYIIEILLELSSFTVSALKTLCFFVSIYICVYLSLLNENLFNIFFCLQITTIGRYGGSTTRSKIPVGSFYGHSFIFPWEWSSYVEHYIPNGHSSATVGTHNTATTASNNVTQNGHEQQQQQHHHQVIFSQLGLFLSLLEDIQCRYSLTKTQLDTLLTSLSASQSASDHTQYYLQKNQKKCVDDKIICIYNDCLQLQQQLNLCQRAIDRLQRGLGLGLPKKGIQ